MFKRRSGGVNSKAPRSSNIELLRIVSMLAIVAHHYVVNSGITVSFDYSDITANMVFLQLWGMWGKTAINSFVLITGYFMCTAKLTWQRYLKIYSEVKFYQILGFMVFAIAGYEVVSAKSLFKLVFSIAYNVNIGFTSSFLVMYLFIPFMNMAIKAFDKTTLLKFIVLSLTVFTVFSTFFFNQKIFHHVMWYMVLYFVGAYLRLYPNKYTETKKYAGIAILLLGGLSYLSVVAVDFIGIKFGFGSTYYMVQDSNKLFAFLIGLSAFIYFKNLNVKNSKFINAVASTTFGVLLIHANSDAMRQWLWKDLLAVPEKYCEPFLMLVVHAFIAMLGVFFICSIIDYVRIVVIEQPIFKSLNKIDLSIILKRFENFSNIFIKRKES